MLEVLSDILIGVIWSGLVTVGIWILILFFVGLIAIGESMN